MKKHMALFLLLTATALVAAEPRPPNILFILADDLGYGELGCYGQQKITTPNIDRLAADGLRFTHHYSGSPVCAPSRCVLLTGKHPGHAFVRDNQEAEGKREGQYPIPATEVTLAELLKARGYTTACIGKWGLGGMETEGSPLKQGFDRFFGYNCQRHAHSYYPAYLWDNNQQIPLKNDPPLKGYEKPTVDPATGWTNLMNRGQDYAPDRCLETARAFIQSNREKPFFLFYATTLPHLALHVPEDALAAYHGKFPEIPYDGGQGYCAHAEPRAAYAAMISRLDRDVGLLMKELDAAGLAEDTLVVFTSDNGPTHDVGGVDTVFFNSAGPLRERKGSLNEGGIRVPAIVKWPGHVRAGATTDYLSGFEDWMPTLLDVAAAKPAAFTDGISLSPTLRGETQAARPFLYREFAGYGGQQAVWVDGWKALRQNLNANRPRKQKLQLYHVDTDAAENEERASAEQERAEALEKIMNREHVPSHMFPLKAIDG